MTPTANITAEYLQEQVNATKSAVESNSGKVAAVIHDNNRINQKFTGMFNTVQGLLGLKNDSKIQEEQLYSILKIHVSQRLKSLGI